MRETETESVSPGASAECVPKAEETETASLARAMCAVESVASGVTDVESQT